MKATLDQVISEMRSERDRIDTELSVLERVRDRRGNWGLSATDSSPNTDSPRQSLSLSVARRYTRHSGGIMPVDTVMLSALRSIGPTRSSALWPIARKIAGRRIPVSSMRTSLSRLRKMEKVSRHDNPGSVSIWSLISDSVTE